MIERIARAIFRRARNETEWADIPEPEKAEWRADAVAALTELREPTEAMTGHAKHLMNLMDRQRFDHCDAAFVWRAMIDAALNTQ